MPENRQKKKEETWEHSLGVGKLQCPCGALCADAHSGVAGCTDLPLGSKLFAGSVLFQSLVFPPSRLPRFTTLSPQPLHARCPGFVASVGRTEESVLPPFLWEPQNPAIESKVSTL